MPEPNSSRTLSVVAVLAMTLLSLWCGSAKAEVTLDLPLRADNLSWREYYARNKATHGGSVQQHGFDLVARRYNSQLGEWSMITVPWETYDKDPRNNLHVIYEHPVYAMESGTVVACWRNAPENPRPARSGEHFGAREQAFLHEKLRSGFMPGGGNILWVDHADGSRALYAHFRTGTIPAALCPIDKALFEKANAGEVEAQLPVADRVEIQRGQYLGLVGNAGYSTGPHLHIHVERDGQAEKLSFNHGLVAAVQGSVTDNANWTSFKGKPIPPGPNLVWPPRKLGDHFARHGFPAAQFHKWFLHLADSGYWLTWIDLFSGAGSNFVNMVWQPARGGWRAFVGVDAQRFQETFDQAVREGFTPVLADVGTWKGEVRYATIFRDQVPGRFRLRSGLTDEQAQAEFAQSTSEGLVPLSASLVSVNGQRLHTVLYRQVAAGSFWARPDMTSAEYEQAWQLNQSQGRNVSFLDIYRHRGQALFSAVFTERPRGEGIGKHGLDNNAFQKAFEERYQEGFRLQLIAGYDGADERRYAAAWFRPESGYGGNHAVTAASASPATPGLSARPAQSSAEKRMPERLRHKTRAVGSSADQGGNIINRR